MKYNIYLDDIRTPIPNTTTHDVPEWIVVRSYDEFVAKITELGLENIGLISLDHDLGDSAMREWHTNVYHNYTLDYNTDFYAGVHDNPNNIYDQRVPE